MWLIVCVLLAYGADIGRGFIADDFGWIHFSRIREAGDTWRLLVDGTPGFYRPLVALSFGVNERLFGLSPMPYALTNLAIAFAALFGIIRLAESLGMAGPAAVFGAGLWALNFHGISMGLMWVSGRTSLLTTLFAVVAAAAFVRGRTLWAGALTLAALLSKEEPIMLPAVFAAWMWIDGARPGAIGRATWPACVAVAIYLVMRARTDAFTPATAPPFYWLSVAPEVIVPNALQYLDRSLTFTAGVLLLGVLLFARRTPALSSQEQRTLWKGLVWLVLGFAVTIMVPVRSSLYVVLPTVGSALIGAAIGAALWRGIPERRRKPALAALLILPILLLPVHWLRHRSTKDQARLSSQALGAIRATLSARPDAQRIVLLDDPAARPTALSVFGGELARAIELAAGRTIAAEIVAIEPGSTPTHAGAPGTLFFALRNGVVVPYDGSVPR